MPARGTGVAGVKAEAPSLPSPGESSRRLETAVGQVKSGVQGSKPAVPFTVISFHLVVRNVWSLLFSGLMLVRSSDDTACFMAVLRERVVACTGYRQQRSGDWAAPVCPWEDGGA